jgi:hypothetical protein
MLSVETLALPHNRIDDAALDIIAQSECLGNLITLDLYRNPVTEEKAQALKKVPALKRLKFIYTD